MQGTLGNLWQSKYDWSMKLSPVFSSSAAVLEIIKPITALMGCSLLTDVYLFLH
jgi:hypothetical protein